MSASFTPEAASPKYVQDMAVVMNLTTDQRNLVCDLGYLNETIYGYVILAMKGAGFSREDIDKAMASLYGVFDENSAADAIKAYKDF